MFVRAVWRHGRPAAPRPTLRKTDARPSINAEIIGLCGPNFTDMTRGLFDRAR
jgi:hypothetical protein